MTAAHDTKIEQAVRKVLGNLLTEVSDELGSPSGNDTLEDGQALPPEVSGALQAVLRDLSPKQAQALASLFQAMGERAEEGEEEQEEEAGEDDADLELATVEEARAQGERLARARGFGAIIKLLRKSPKLFTAAVRAAKGGYGAFNRWVNGLSNFNPAKWALKGLSRPSIVSLIAELASLL
ncbi:MAG TPA: hypothetical protein VFS43_24780 [Polyangiaceae bacterium]|nr:hypothetical protein [Polyangiaceae bacterium]